MEEKTVRQSTLHPSFRPFRDYLVTMVPLALLATYLYGLRVVLMLTIATVTAVLCDLFVAMLRQRHIRLSDISSYTFAWTVTLMLPVSVSYGTVIFAVCATLLLGKHAFGGYGSYPFHPAAFGFCLTAISNPSQVFMFPVKAGRIALGWIPEVNLHQSPAKTLQEGGVPMVDRTDLLLGDFSGPVGGTFCLIILACLVLLIVHRAVCWHIPASYIATCVLWAYIFPRIDVSSAESVLFEIFCCGIPFAAAYLVAEPTVIPRNTTARFLYGAAAAVLTMLISRFGIYEAGAPFAVLLSAPIGYWLDRRLDKPENREANNG